MRCKACDAPIPVSWRYIQEIDKAVLEDLCFHCLNAVRSSTNLIFPPDNKIEDNLALLGIHVEQDMVLDAARELGGGGHYEEEIS